MTQQIINTKSRTKALKRAFVYLRVSSDSQVKTDYDADGLSIAAQREASQDKATQLGAEIAGEYSDPGRSAYQDLHKRTEFLAMLDELKRRNQSDATRVDYVIVWSLSRWARNTVDHWRARDQVRKTGARLISISEPGAGEDTASGFLYEGMLVTYNQYNSMLTGESISRGLAQKAKGGGTGRPAPIGYLNTVEVLSDGRRVASVDVDPERGPFIQVAFRLYASGEYTISQLVTELAGLGLVTRPSEKRPVTKPISKSVLQHLLRNPYYVGKMVFKRGTPDEQVFDGRHEPLIDQETFDEVQARLDEKRVAGERPQIRSHYLKGSVFCGCCRRRLLFGISTGRNGTKYPYFFCASRVNGSRCPQRANMRPELIEAAICRYYRTRPVELTARDVAERTGAVQALADASQQAVVQVRKAKQELIANLQAKQERLLLLYAEEGESVSPDASRATRKRLQDQIEAAETSLAETDDRLRIDADQLRIALELAEDAALVYAAGDETTKRGYNQAFFKRLYVTPEWDEEADCLVAEITDCELTDPYSVLLADGLAREVRAEVEHYSGRKTEGDSWEPPSTGVSIFESLVELGGLEPPTSWVRSSRSARREGGDLQGLWWPIAERIHACVDADWRRYQRSQALWYASA